MKHLDSEDLSDEELGDCIESLAYRMGREPYTFHDADGDPWAVLIRVDDYDQLVADSEELTLFKALLSPL